MTRLRWEIAERLSALHAARCWAAGAAGIDPAAVQKISPPLSLLTQRLAAADLDLAVFWRRLVAAAAAGRDDLQACQQALAASGVGELALDATASAISSLLAETRFAFQERYPKLAEQLSLRARPLREQWEAYGAGLLRRVAASTHESFIPKTASVLLVSPYRGGDGDCDPSLPKKLWIEAVLTNPIAAIPEVLRLTWLVGRIGLAAQIIPPVSLTPGEVDDPCARGFDVLSLALVPITLDAAAHLELGPSPAESPQLIATAAEAWNGSVDPEVIQAVQRWWSQSLELAPPFPVALKALDRMLPGKPSLQFGSA
jgi:hypothetical protein